MRLDDFTEVAGMAGGHSIEMLKMAFDGYTSAII